MIVTLSSWPPHTGSCPLPALSCIWNSDMVMMMTWQSCHCNCHTIIVTTCPWTSPWPLPHPCLHVLMPAWCMPHPHSTLGPHALACATVIWWQWRHNNCSHTIVASSLWPPSCNVHAHLIHFLCMTRICLPSLHIRELPHATGMSDSKNGDLSNHMFLLLFLCFLSIFHIICE